MYTGKGEAKEEEEVELLFLPLDLAI
jgi:hypothetical protein